MILPRNKSAYMRLPIQPDDEYPQTLEMPSFKIFLEARHSTDGVLLKGQIVALGNESQSQWKDALIELRQAESALTTTTTDTMGNFRLSGLKPVAAEIAITTVAGTSLTLDTEPLIPEE